MIRWLLNLIDPYPRERKELERELARDYSFRCPHDDYLCDKYGCPDDPSWKGDGCR